MQPLSSSSQPLTVAEALVLQDPNKAQGRTALKLTLTDLLARRVLTLRQEETKGRWGRAHKTEYLHLTPQATTWFGQYPHVRAVVDAIVGASSPGTEPSMQQVVANASKVFGADLGRYQTDYVMPALIQRGLIQATQEKVLFVFTTTRYQRTPTGEAAAQELQAQMAKARRIPTMLDGADPREIAALVAGLGITLLLVDELRPHYGRLSQTLRTQAASQGGEGGYFASDTSSDDSNDRDTEPQELTPDASMGLDAANFGDFNMDSLDLDAFDSLDSSLDAFDSSFDSSADSGGGGDGGGDGGGGGGGD